MAFSGDVSVMSLDEVMGFLATNGLEGVLTVCGTASSLKLFFREGKIVCPATPPQRKSGRIDKGALSAILARGRKVSHTSDRVRKIEAQPKLPGKSAKQRPPRGKLPPDVIDKVLASLSEFDAAELTRRIEEAIHEVLLWHSAWFEFKPGKLPGHVLRDIKRGRFVEFDTNSLMMDAARRRDDTKRLEALKEEDVSAEAPPNADRRGDLYGDLVGIGLAAVLQSLNAQRRSGTLAVFTKEHRENLYFENGDAFVLITDDEDEDPFAREMLGTWLDKTVDLTEGFTANHPGLVLESDLTDAELRAIKDRFLEMLFWEDAAEFVFHQGELPPEFYEPGEQTSKIALQTQRFLLEAIQRLIEWDQVRRSIGGRDAILDFLDFERKMDTSANMRGGSLQVMTLIDGRLSFEEIVRLSGLEHMEVGRIVRDLVDQGHLRVVGED